MGQEKFLTVCLWGGCLRDPSIKITGDSLLEIYILKKLFIYLFIYFMAVLGLRFCVRAFSSGGKCGPFLIAVRGPPIIVASLGAEHRLQTRRLSSCGTGSRRAGSVVVAHGPSCSAACGIFPDQGPNPCALRWQADSQPLRHQGSPRNLHF